MTASLVAENRTLAVPASIQSIPTTADFQDVVSFGLIAGRKARTIVENTDHILSFELLCAAQAADLRGADRLSPAGRILHAAVRETLPYLDRDEVYMDAIEELTARIASDELVTRVEREVGELCSRTTGAHRTYEPHRALTRGASWGSVEGAWRSAEGRGRSRRRAGALSGPAPGERVASGVAGLLRPGPSAAVVFVSAACAPLGAVVRDRRTTRERCSRGRGPGTSRAALRGRNPAAPRQWGLGRGRGVEALSAGRGG